MLRIFKIFVFLCWAIVLVFIVSLQLESDYLQSLLYLWISLGWIFSVYLFRVTTQQTFAITVTLFLLSAIITTASFINLGEIFLRVSFIGLIMGYAQSLIKYKSA